MSLEEIADLIGEAQDLNDRIGGRITGNQKAWMAKVEDILIAIVGTLDSFAEEMSVSGGWTVPPVEVEVTDQLLDG